MTAIDKTVKMQDWTDCAHVLIAKNEHQWRREFAAFSLSTPHPAESRQSQHNKAKIYEQLPALNSEVVRSNSTLSTGSLNKLCYFSDGLQKEGVKVNWGGEQAGTIITAGCCSASWQTTAKNLGFIALITFQISSAGAVCQQLWQSYASLIPMNTASDK